MRRFILPIAAILLTAACGGGSTGDTKAIPAHTSSRPPVKNHGSTAKATHSGPRPGKPKPSGSAKNCPPTRDILVWTKSVGVPANAQALGNYSQVDCSTTFQWLQRTSPTEAGDCTEAAWASDNPGYNVDAVPAARLRKVQMAVGPAC
ncbi:hypothetical protein ACFVHS_25445 [Streptomyces sp. NPDC057746]|uniref:hypothetical protein n=1 Tax=Streptomyces sp. NPDC057746 TaxID=3346237 RepID=UPI0036869A8B